MVRKARISSKGQITIPQEVRKALKLRKGDSVLFELEGDQALFKPERPEDPFARWMGAWREGEGDDLDTIIQRERENRGW